ncbi:hypothetical protein F0919_18005 [Taibaiella lutea]|uniref:Uncharacterized protein n=1 Tax=Taibaiella lutea TaxID=2608001 RepID=A0A5M6CGY4_9BACT|nr:hypothetical protein [Taibaiella lutea]KAA5532675.1 hypothetical protein F0919_18005 [Taibaiella lutea]
MKTGIELIAQERQEQIEKHGRTVKSDFEENSKGQLIRAAITLLTGSGTLPANWNFNYCTRLMQKSERSRKIVAGALIAADLDREQYEEHPEGFIPKNMPNTHQMREKHPEMVRGWENLSKEDLLEAMCGEVLDLFSMMERVSIFMEECTNMSKVTYTPEVIKEMIKKKKEEDINDFCFLECEESEDEDILSEIKERAKKSTLN